MGIAKVRAEKYRREGEDIGLALVDRRSSDHLVPLLPPAVKAGNPVLGE